MVLGPRHLPTHVCLLQQKKEKKKKLATLCIKYKTNEQELNERKPKRKAQIKTRKEKEEKVRKPTKKGKRKKEEEKA